VTSVHVYLPDDEPDEQACGGHVYRLRPNATTEFIPFDPELAKVEPGVAADETKLARLEADGAVQMVRQPDVSPVTVAAFIAEKLWRWGVTVTTGPVRDGVATQDGDRDTVARARDKYLRGTREWAHELILASHKETQDFRDAGLEVTEPANVQKARKWLSDHASALAGLT
jgi:hypothetical protein